ncbi:hypothetical protein K1T71_005795 [Dendrolimus kikuchii]|uniref:Uncharacterized protein n=1 Tax=Dendrolimus kikuchii TaxID=765133 RepID=A0ACC1D5D5_9NEOP|nr:hypothetical protein K1T71_005795 [Dendrolimus kikuchii]
MRDLTKLETEERIAEVAVCCPGYKMRDVSCVPICPNGRTGARCSEVCRRNKWGPNCVNDCKQCDHGSCSPVSGECWCEDGWQGESCESSMPTTTVENILTTTKTTPMTIAPSTKITTASIATGTKAQPSISTTSITSRPTNFKSTTELSMKIPITENTIAKESAAPIEIKMFTTINIYSTEKAVRLPKEDISGTTERSSTTSVGFNTIRNITLQSTNQYHKEIITVNPVIIQEPMTVNDNNNIYDKNAVNDATHTIQLKDLISTQTAVIVKQDTTTKVPVTDIVLLKNNSLDNNTIKPKSILSFNNITTPTSETTTNIVEMKTGKQPSIEATTTSTISENRVQSRETENLTTTEIKTMVILTTSEPPKVTSTISQPSVIQTMQKTESTTSIETTTRVPTTTAKFKPKEIWIKPAQKGDSIESKSKNNHELQRHKPTNKELSINTTPKTIIVSIIPTSVSYATFKKIALTTTAYLPTKINTSLKILNKTEQGFTKAMPTYLTTTSSSTEISTVTSSNTTLLPNFKYTSILPVTENTTISNLPTSSVSSKSIKTNSMTTNAVTSNNLTISTNSTTSILTTTSKTIETTKVTKPVKNYHWITAKESFKTNKTLTSKLEVVINRTTNTKVAIDINKTLTNDKLTTETPSDEETFHILTEPEHITAVMGDKESDRTSMDLKSVISIAGGVMMAVITVAVIIVMIERCKRPRYEDVRKINDIRMQVMIDDNDVPPPYVRSIFHTPLPEPPMPDKCHYQPISTLDRNLKQFMRPVVVQAISPIMLENFRGILECHYDHLPRRSHDFQPIPVRCSVAPSVDFCELTPLRGHTVSDHDIDSMKREAKLDEIDNTTAEPLYAEIPCWRPPSEHAIEILNLNGEAVTEL